MAKWHDAKVVERIDWNDHLFSLRFSCEQFPKFTAGQFTKIGIEQADGKVLSRPYSLVNGPDESCLEIIAVPVAEGSLSPRLHEVQVGDRLKVMSPPTGFLVLDEVPPSETLFLLATGTGVGPFLSILASSQPWDTYNNIVLVYGVRQFEDLAYLTKIEKWLSEHPLQFKFVPIVSRQTVADTLQGRIPQLINDDAISTLCGQEFDPSNCQVMLCGNPDMIQQTISELEARGFKKHLRRSPGQISMERYW
ncbi:ferredoxin--NADP reductase [Aliiglaciecola sp. LCG003]|uniref:ferredoxin--NADP reductase n=1 Tax=Aliiglaciecola sp. LCG003 TaxID=3053655 RepID=UPI0025725B9C|nr:ferredoxin--NADP reductase [Aliiglaciecola sp. LCG003]WJG09816.1 ferredoxin--NADP reductase [Aliiglaciecola sp. LCG003]